MLKKIRRYIEQWNMIEKQDKIIAGVSGGADSVCLLLALIELQEELSFDLVVVHVNHGLRGKAAEADEAYVEKLCKTYRIPCVIYREDIELIAKKRKQSLEEAGREVRREAFQKTLKQYGGTKIALAHHKNDNAETFLMNLARGAGLKGLGGMKPVNGVFIRPLLAVDRVEIEMYLQKKETAFCTDETNESDDYTRNRVRNHLVPYLEEKVNKNAVSHINETMEQLREIQGFMEEQTDIARAQCIREKEGGCLIAGEPFEQIPKVIQPFVLKRALKEISGREKDITSVHVQQLQELLEKQVGRKMDFPYQIEGKRVYEGVILTRKDTVRPEEKEARIFEHFGPEQEEAHVLEWYGHQVKYRVWKAEHLPEDRTEKIYTKWFDYDIIKGTVSVRTREAGDYITIHGDGKTQKLKSYFINEKIPQERRKDIPLIAEGNHILWIVGYRVSDAYRITKNTKRILEIQIDEGEHYVRKNQSISIRRRSGCKN